MPAASRPSEPQNLTQGWLTDSETQARCDALIREVLTGLEKEESVQNIVAGYQSESQGE